MTDTGLLCYACNLTLSSNLFSPNSKNSRGYNSWCNPCESERGRLKKTPEGKVQWSAKLAASQAARDSVPTRSCTDCGLVADKSLFLMAAGSGQKKVGPWCPPCRLKRDRARRARSIVRGAVESVSRKACSRCMVVKPASAFAHAPHTRTGLQSWCMDCNSAKGRERYRKDPEKKMASRDAYLQTPAGQETYSRYIRKRRATKKAAFVEHIDDEWVRISHNFRCQLCGRHIPPRSDENGIEKYHLDHIVPLSLGGKHEWANAGASHAVCNLKKGDKQVAPKFRHWWVYLEYVEPSDF